MGDYVDTLEKLDFFFLGEPLLDPFLEKRISMAKRLGYKSIAVSTNAQLLDRKRQERLLGSGVDCIIFSVDGIRKETHEAIRRGVDFNAVMKNILDTISLRDTEDYPTRFVLRMVYQDRNRDEWDAYKLFWDINLSGTRGDVIIRLDVNNYGSPDWNHATPVVQQTCHQLWDRLIILVDGVVPLCCMDMAYPIYPMGDATIEHPLSIYNNERFNRIRAMHLQGEREGLELCDACTILENEKHQEVIHPGL
jgi:hypothetical protein